MISPIEMVKPCETSDGLSWFIALVKYHAGT